MGRHLHCSPLHSQDLGREAEALDGGVLLLEAPACDLAQVTSLPSHFPSVKRANSTPGGGDTSGGSPGYKSTCLRLVLQQRGWSLPPAPSLHILLHTSSLWQPELLGFVHNRKVQGMPFLRTVRGSGMCPCPHPPWARTQHSSLGTFLAWLSASCPC